MRRASWSEFLRAALLSGWRLGQAWGLWHAYLREAGRVDYYPVEPPRAADVLARMDYDETDSPSVDALGVEGFRFPEPGGRVPGRRGDGAALLARNEVRGGRVGPEASAWERGAVAPARGRELE